MTPEEKAELDAEWERIQAEDAAPAKPRPEKPGWLLRIEAEAERKAAARAGIRRPSGKRKETITVIRPPGTLPLPLNEWYSTDGVRLFNGRGKEVKPAIFNGVAYARVYVVWDGEKRCYRKKPLLQQFEEARKRRKP